MTFKNYEVVFVLFFFMYLKKISTKVVITLVTVAEGHYCRHLVLKKVQLLNQISEFHYHMRADVSCRCHRTPPPLPAFPIFFIARFVPSYLGYDRAWPS